MTGKPKNSYQYKKVSEGSKVGRLTVIQVVSKSKAGNGWLCSCECGNSVVALASSLNSGLKQSCGCLKSNPRKKPLVSSWRREYNSWLAMRQRCHYPKHQYYDLYGGRGITHCERWKSFENFLNDMGEKPEGYSLDRIDPNGNYEPSNCRWASHSTQARNTRKQLEEDCGVSWHKTQKCWHVSIGVSGRSQHIGSFSNYEEALLARKEAEELFWKD